MTERCVCCGAEVPEGRQVCPKCERDSCLHLWLFERRVILNGEPCICMKCRECGLERHVRHVDRRWFEE